ncbi:MAG: hypothetical protein IKZ48_01550 [Prevotella sp.]|nr:hypothetical protein [Prevotella sp.]
MKRILLPVLFSMAVVASYAQQKPVKVAFDGKAKMEKMNFLQKGDFNQPLIGAKKKTHKSKADGVYYTKPDCAMWAGESIEGSYYYASLLLLPPYGDLTFNNKSTDKAKTIWTWRDESVDAEENGDFYFGSAGCYQTSGYNNFGDAPVLSKKEITYSLENLNDNWVNSSDDYIQQRNQYPDYFGCSMQRDSLADMVFFDATHAVTGGAWGISQPDDNTNYLFGNGSVKTENASYVIAGFSQIYPRPYNLYLTSAHSTVYTMGQPLSGDAVLTMSFYNVEEVDGEEVIGDKLLGRFYATATNQVNLGGPYNTKWVSTGSVYIYSLEFKNEHQDEIGSWVTEPVVLNEKFAMVITGFDQEGVDVNFLGSVPQDEEDFEGQTEILVWADESKEKIGSFMYQSQIVIDVTFTGLFDYSEVLATGYDNEGTEYTNLNVLQVSADGKTVTEYGSENEGVAIVYTAYPWIDDQGIDNYYYELPEWISDMAYEEAEPSVQSGIEFRNGRVFLQPLCDALPTGVEGRYAIVYIEGKGTTSEDPIIVLQGNAKLEDALNEINGGSDYITTIASNMHPQNTTFNLAGQKVGKNFKGMVVKNGKKLFVK